MRLINVLVLLNAALGFGSLLLGLMVSVQAFRGYRRSERGTMGLFAIGLGLILVVSPLVRLSRGIGQEAVAPSNSTLVWAVSHVLENGFTFLGICIIIYALYAKRTT